MGYVAVIYFYCLHTIKRNCKLFQISLKVINKLAEEQTTEIIPLDTVESLEEQKVLTLPVCKFQSLPYGYSIYIVY